MLFLEMFNLLFELFNILFELFNILSELFNILLITVICKNFRCVLEISS